MKKSPIREMINKKAKFLIGLTSPKTAVKLRYFNVFKTLPNLNNPVTFNEKINAYKFMGDKYDFHKYADKVAVKDYVAEKIGAEHVIPTLFAGKTLPPREERTWEMPYIIKLNHCSGWNVMVRNEKERDWSKIEKQIAKWSKKTFGKDTGEVHYSKIEPMVLVEKFISENNNNELPHDYKMHMIHGKIEFTEVDVRKTKTDVTYTYYDRDWNKLPLCIVDFPETPAVPDMIVPKPKNYEQMLEFAEILSKDFPLVRVDFYNLDGHIYFGEMTFTPFAGFCRIWPEKYDYIYGEKLVLD